MRPRQLGQELKRKRIKDETNPFEDEDNRELKRPRLDAGPVISIPSTTLKDLKILSGHMRGRQQAYKLMKAPEVEAQSMLFVPAVLGIYSNELSYCEHDAHEVIDASVGSSGFLPHEDITTGTQQVDHKELVEYDLEGEVNPSETGIHSYLIEEGIIDTTRYKSLEFTESGQEPQKDCLYACLGCGSQQLLFNAFKAIIKNPGDVIILTKLTYGLLFPAITMAGGKYKFLELKEEDGYKVNPAALFEVLNSTNYHLTQIHKAHVRVQIDKIKRNVKKGNESRTIIAKALALEEKLKWYGNRSPWYGSSLKNPIKEFNEELRKFVESDDFAKDKTLNEFELQAEKESFYNDHKINFGNCIRGFLHINPHQTGSVMSQDDVNQAAEVLSKFPKVAVLEDSAHYGILLSKAQMGFFSRSVLKENTLSFFSFSKNFSYASARAGFVVGKHKHITKIADNIHHEMVMVPLMVAKTITAVTSTPKSKRDAYLAECNAAYTYRLQIVKAFIYGIDSITDHRVKKSIVGCLEELGLESDILKEGIKNISFLNMPDGCFFVMLNMSKYCGYFLGEIQLSSSLDFSQLFFYGADVKTLPSLLCGYDEKPSLRFSLSISESEIVFAMLRMKKMLSYLTPKPNKGFTYPQVEEEVDKPSRAKKR